jgi:hypothetical protein
MGKATPAKPEILRLASILGCSHGDAFLLLFQFWCWCDDQLTDGNATGVTPVMLDALLKCDGLCAALVEVGWLQVRSGSLVIPRFDRHFSESAKKRTLSAKRQADFRSRKRNAKSNADALPQNRTEENSSYGVSGATLSSSSLRENENKPERAISGGGRKKRTRSDFDASDVLLPGSLGRLPAFRSAWLDWCRYRASKRKPITELACRQQLEELEKVGPDAAAAAIRKAIANDWQGLFPEAAAGVQSHAGLRAWAEQQGDLDS